MGLAIDWLILIVLIGFGTGLEHLDWITDVVAITFDEVFDLVGFKVFGIILIIDIFF